MQVDGIFGDAEDVGDLDDRVLELENALAVEDADDLLVFLRGDDVGVDVDPFLRAHRGLPQQLVRIAGIALLDKAGREPGTPPRSFQ